MSQRKTIDLGTTDDGRTLRLPNEIATETTAVIGRRGSGKSNTLTVCLEGLAENGYQFVLIDHKGEGWGLRRPGPGGKSGYPVIVFGEPEGDLPLDEQNGPTIADFVVDSGRSCVLSLAGFDSDESERRFVTAFCDRLYRRKMAPEHQTPLLVALEEAHLFVPQSVGRDQTKLVRSIQRLVRQGRSYGIGMMLADQRPASVNKDVLTQLEVLICHQVSSPQDRKAVGQWVEAHDAEGHRGEFLESIAGLRPGQAWIWSPARLDLFQRVTVRQRWTYDSGATPTQIKAQPPGEAKEVDLEELRGQLEEVVEEAKANDPKELKKRIRELEKELEAEKGRTEYDPEAVQQLVAERDQQWRRIIAEWRTNLHQAASEIASGHANLQNISESIGRMGDLPPGPMPDPTVKSAGKYAPDMRGGREAPGSGSVDNSASDRRPAVHGRPRHRSNGTGGSAGGGAGGGVKPALQRILDAIAWFEAVGIPRPHRSHVAAIAGVSPKSSAYANNVSRLSSLGLIRYPESGYVELTPEGEAQARGPEVPGSPADLHRAWLSSPALKPAQRRLLEVVIDQYELSREELAEAVGASPASSAFANNVSRLSSLGLIRYPQPGYVQATELLHPKGLLD